jgi:hypothetical protein
MNGHRLQSIKVQRVAVVLHPSSDEPVLIYAGNEREAIGCEDCNMTLDDAMTTQCAGALTPVKDAG